MHLDHGAEHVSASVCCEGFCELRKEMLVVARQRCVHHIFHDCFGDILPCTALNMSSPVEDKCTCQRRNTIVLGSGQNITTPPQGKHRRSPVERHAGNVPLCLGQPLRQLERRSRWRVLCGRCLQKQRRHEKTTGLLDHGIRSTAAI